MPPELLFVSNYSLVAVFKMMKLHDRLTACKVSPHWFDLVRVANHSEHSLTILGGGSTADLQAYLFRINSLSIASKPSIRMLTYHSGGDGDGEGETGRPLFPVTRFTDWNSLLFGAAEGPYKAELDSATVETIVSVFPHITELTFAVYRNANYEHLIDMLTHRRWNQQLARLTLVDHHQCRISAAMNRILFATLNTLASLKVLAFSLFPQCQLYDLPLLAQLDEVAVCVDDAVLPTFLQSLERHADANLALQVAIRSDATEHLFTLSGHLRNRLVRFCNTKLGYSSNSVPLLCANFRQLTTLSIYSHTSRILKSLFADLTQLPYLFHLDISIDFRYECDAVHHLAVLPSVRALDLQLFITSHQQVRDLNLRSALPNLAALHLHYFWCIECDRPSYLCTDDLKEEEEEEGKMELTLKCLFLTLSDLHSGVPPECISIEEFPGTAAQMFAQKSCI